MQLSKCVFADGEDLLPLLLTSVHGYNLNILNSEVSNFMWKAMKRAWNALVTRPYASTTVINGSKRSIGVVASAGVNGGRMAANVVATGGVVATTSAHTQSFPSQHSIDAAVSPSTTIHAISVESDGGHMDDIINSILCRRIEELNARRTMCLQQSPLDAGSEEEEDGVMLSTGDVITFLRSHETALLGDHNDGPTVVVPRSSNNTDIGLFNGSLQQLLNECNDDDNKTTDTPDNGGGLLASKPPMYRLMFHGSPNALSILTNRSPNGTGFEVPPPLSDGDVNTATTTTRPDTCYEGVYLTPSYTTALSYAGLTTTTTPSVGNNINGSPNAGVLVCAVQLGRTYNEFLEGPDTALERQLADVVKRRKHLESQAGITVGGGGGGEKVANDGAEEVEVSPPQSHQLQDVQFDTRMSWLDETAVYCVVDPLRVLPILCIRPPQ